jgi:hypothetical protein
MGSGFQVRDSGFGVQGSWFGVQGSEIRVSEFQGFRVSGFGFAELACGSVQGFSNQPSQPS